jgi:hypothetical protein
MANTSPVTLPPFVDREVRPVAVLASMLAPHLGSEDAAVAFMRAFPGTLIQVPALAAIEKYRLEQRAAPRVLRDPAEEVVRLLRVSGSCVPR